MFSLFYGLWKYLVSKTEFHVLILGIDKAGKTVNFHQLFFLLSCYFFALHIITIHTNDKILIYQFPLGCSSYLNPRC